MAKPHLRYPSAREMSKLARQASQNDIVTLKDDDVIAASGIYLADATAGALTATIAAPEPGDHVLIRTTAVGANTLVVTAVDGVTLDGTNNTATFNAAADTLELVYKAAGTWAVLTNTSVTLSDV